MPGRHAPEGSARSPRRTRLVLGAGALVVVGAVGAAFAFGNASAKTSHNAAAAPCTSPVTIRVATSPVIADSIRTLATNWQRTARCTTVTVTPVDDRAAESAFASGGQTTDLWIPNSTVWAQELSADLTDAGAPAHAVTIGASVASSPLVLVAPAGASLPPVTPTVLAAALESGKAPFRLPSPLSSSEGVLGLHLLSALQPATSRRTPALAMQNLMAAMVVLSRSSIATPADGYAVLGKSVQLFGASEQSVIAANRAAGQPVADAVYPAKVVGALDFPVVTISHPDANPAVVSAAAAFGATLPAVAAQGVFAANGFRDAKGDPIPGITGVGSAPIAQLPQPTLTETTDDLRMWSAATEASHTLAVIDVSGSMSEQAGNGQSKIAVAAQAAAAAVGYFGNNSAFGLWAFSSGKANGRPYAELAPLATLGSKDGTRTQRQALVAAALGLPGQVGGSTGLYDTALAAFEDVRNSYDPAKVNSVVLLTDGQNDYSGGLTLTQLLTKLRSLADPARPVPILTIGIGNQADIATLRQISAVTGGKTYVVANPAEIRGVFLDAMLQRQCRPDCGS
jgi:Mg-chelatase subunit ChlD